MLNYFICTESQRDVIFKVNPLSFLDDAMLVAGLEKKKMLHWYMNLVENVTKDIASECGVS